MDFHSLTDREKTEFLRSNFPANAKSLSGRVPLYGIAINDSDYVSSPFVNSIRFMCPAYDAWKGMVQRVYCEKFHKRYPTYSNVRLCNEWHSFMTFREWWIENQVDKWHIDKDLLTDTLEYGPKSCIFVPAWLNNFLTDHRALRGLSPIGSHWHKGNMRYVARCSHPITRVRKHLGNFKSADAAHEAWLTYKIKIATDLKDVMDGIDKRIYPRVIHVIENAK